MKKHPYLYSFLALLIIWELISFFIKKSFLPSPVVTLSYAGMHAGLLLKHVLASLTRIGLAVFFAVLFGCGIGIAIGRIEMIDKFLTPFLYTLYPIPKIAFLPIIMLFLGLGNASKVTLVALILFFQIVISTRDSVRSIHPAYFIAIKSLGSTSWQSYQHVIFPAMLPGLFTSLRITIGTAISVLFFAENYATKAGIGYYIMDSWLKLNYTAMFAGIVTISVMGILLFTAIDILEAHICKWT